MAKRVQAFTMVEMMITVSIFSVVVLALVYTQIFGLQQDRLVGSKLGASDQSRAAFDQMSRDIRSAKIYQIGDISGTTFSANGLGASQRGRAIQLCLSTNTSVYVVYYFDATAGELRRIHSSVTGSTLVAKNLTNSMVFTNSMYFTAEHIDGTVQTDHSHKGIIHATLCFWQYQYPQTFVGNGNYYDFYKMEFKLSPHVPDGP
jgi:prepilin-type N-terminal cleavage/methylation domain-containing protein